MRLGGLAGVAGVSHGESVHCPGFAGRCRVFRYPPGETARPASLNLAFTATLPAHSLQRISSQFGKVAVIFISRAVASNVEIRLQRTEFILGFPSHGTFDFSSFVQLFSLAEFALKTRFFQLHFRLLVFCQGRSRSMADV